MQIMFMPSEATLWNLFASAAGHGGRVKTLVEDVISKDAYIANAQFHLDSLRSTIHDGLTGKNDWMLKDSLLEDLDAAASNLQKALK